jgi:DNA transposition AAA+ family ATPase
MSIENILKLPFGKLLDEYKNLTGVSQNKLSYAVGVSGSQLSQIKNGTYKDVDGTEEKVREYIKTELEKIQVKSFEAPLLEFNYIKGARLRIDGVIKKEKIALLRGDSGSGKTTLLKEFHKRYVNSFIIQAYKGMKRSELIDEIYKSHGIKNFFIIRHCTI